MESLKQKAKDIKIVFFDIDDTLRVKNTGVMPESVTQAFHALRERGIKTGIATGRSYFGVVPEVKALDPDFFVTINGAVAIDRDHQPIFKNPMSKALIEEVVAWADGQGIDYAFVGNDEVVVSDWNANVADIITHVYGELRADKDFYLTSDVYQMLTFERPGQKVDGTFTESLNSQVRLVRWHERSSDIVKNEGSKALGVSKVLDYLGLTKDNMMNFGDELNDRELFDLSAIGVAMKVSHPEILEKADYVTGTVEADGIYNALKTLGII
jgi:peptidyl-prolyl cis-trans isomerase B (cyclophilin B)